MEGNEDGVGSGVSSLKRLILLEDMTFDWSLPKSDLPVILGTAAQLPMLCNPRQYPAGFSLGLANFRRRLCQA